MGGFGNGGVQVEALLCRLDSTELAGCHLKDSTENESNQRVPFPACDRDRTDHCEVNEWIDLTNFLLTSPLGASVPRPASIK